MEARREQVQLIAPGVRYPFIHGGNVEVEVVDDSVVVIVGNSVTLLTVALAELLPAVLKPTAVRGDCDVPGTKQLPE
jgi:hypothetical protein